MKLLIESICNDLEYRFYQYPILRNIKIVKGYYKYPILYLYLNTVLSTLAIEYLVEALSNVERGSCVYKDNSIIYYLENESNVIEGKLEKISEEISMMELIDMYVKDGGKY